MKVTNSTEYAIKSLSCWVDIYHEYIPILVVQKWCVTPVSNSRIAVVEYDRVQREFPLKISLSDVAAPITRVPVGMIGEKRLMIWASCCREMGLFVYKCE